MRKINTLLIGVGYHAKRIYVPDFKNSELVNFVACLDLESERGKIEGFLKQQGIVASCYYTTNYEIADNLGREELEQLGLILRKHSIEAVVISTEPLAHFKYTKWALQNSLHILLDKPITTEVDVSIRGDKANKLFSDYKKIEEIYKKRLATKNLVFMLQAQRRFHEGFVSVKDKIREMAQLSGCPVTSIISFHSDGQWRFPKEIIEQDYHPYNQGYGKMSHSGYHSLDVATWFAEASLSEQKYWDNFKLYAQFVRPNDFISQLSECEYLKLFPDIDRDLISAEVFRDVNNIKGELDAFINISLKKGKDTITNIICNALHNGFSQRNWTNVLGRDLYKGNGRVRHESYIIEQGPFQSIIINSFQSKEILKSNQKLYDVGGEYHFDIHIFRNKAMFPDCKSYEFINMKNLRPMDNRNYDRGHQEAARRTCNAEFFTAILQEVPASKQTSNFLSHCLTTQLLSATYLSAADQCDGGDGVINQNI